MYGVGCEGEIKKEKLETLKNTFLWSYVENQKKAC